MSKINFNSKDAIQIVLDDLAKLKQSIRDSNIKDKCKQLKFLGYHTDLVLRIVNNYDKLMFDPTKTYYYDDIIVASSILIVSRIYGLAISKNNIIRTFGVSIDEVTKLYSIMIPHVDELITSCIAKL